MSAARRNCCAKRSAGTKPGISAESRAFLSRKTLSGVALQKKQVSPYRQNFAARYHAIPKKKEP
jgi:hypothetical protein